MSNEQAVSTPPENASYDDDMFADVRAAVTEVNKAPETPAEPIAEKPAEPVAETPAEPKADHPTDEKRYADGTFKPIKGEKDEAPPAASAPKDVKPEAPEPPAADLAPPAPAAQGNPPPGWSVKSKAEWDRLPEHIRADIIKREQEVNTGFAQYSGMKDLVPYQQRAQSQGQTLKQVLDSFIGMEDLLRQNPEQGFMTIASRLGIPMQRLANAFAQYGQSNGQYTQQPGYQPPAQDGWNQPQIDPTILQQYVNPLAQEVNGIKSLVQQIQQAETNRFTTAFKAAEQRFASEPESRFYENVKTQMAQLFQGGFVQETGDHYADLKAAYDMACNMNPEIRELRINERIAKTEEQRRKAEQEAAEKAKHASRSITGSPAAGAPTTPDDKDDSIEADVRRAYRAHAA